MPKVEVILRDEHLRDKTSFDDLPYFDVIVTGNKEFIKTMKSEKKVKFVSRSKICGFDISGENIRKIMRMQRKHLHSNRKFHSLKLNED